MWKSACEVMPLGGQTLSKSPDQFVKGLYPIFAKSAQGAYIIDLNDNKYLDFMCGLGPIVLGYNDEAVNHAIKKQLDSGIIFSLPTLLEKKLADLIIDVVPCAEMVRFAKNGTDVCTAAVRIARSYTKRQHILKCGYHGWSDWHAITTVKKYGIPECLENIVHEFKYNDLRGLERLLRAYNVAGVIMEPEALEKPHKGYLSAVKDLAHKYGALLIFDEIVTGFRWDIGGAQARYEVTPDLCCLGKSIANGMPISVIAGKKKYMRELEHIFFSMTFGGECLSMAAAIATIEQLKTKEYSHIWDLNELLIDGFLKKSEKHNLKINFAGHGPRHNLTFSSEYKDSAGMKDLFFQEMVKRGILFPNVIYIQFSHTKGDISKTIEAADKAFEKVAENKSNIDAALEGERSLDVFIKRDKT